MRVPRALIPTRPMLSIQAGKYDLTCSGLMYLQVRAKVEQRRGEASSKQSQNAMHKALMAAASNGDIPGIFGRLGEHRGVQGTVTLR